MGIHWRSAARGSKEGVTFCISSRTWHKSSGVGTVGASRSSTGKAWEILGICGYDLNI